MFRKLCGGSTLQNVVLVTNMWKEESMAINESRERDLSGCFLRPAIDLGARLVRHHDTTESAYNILRMIMKNHPVALKIQRELVYENNDIIDTEATRGMRYLIEKHPPPLQEGASPDEDQSNCVPPAMIACVPNGPLSCWDLILIVAAG